MEIKYLEIYKKQSEIFKALGHPTRLFIVHQLGKRDYCVCELTKMIGNDISTISKHLSVLKNAGIINYSRKANKIIYHLQLRCILNISICSNLKTKENL